MAREDRTVRRPLLAGGEKLKSSAQRSSGGGPKYHPFTVEEAHAMLLQQAETLAAGVAGISEDLRGTHVVFEAMVHPNYVADSYFPAGMFEQADLYVVGTRRRFAPHRTKTREKQDVPTKSFLVAGKPERVVSFAKLIAKPPTTSALNWDEVRQFREIGITPPSRVVRKVPSSLGEGELITWEAVLSSIGRNEAQARSWGDAAFVKFIRLVRKLGGDVDTEYRRVIDGLSFVPILLHGEAISDAAKFNLLRALRPMPKIRPLRPIRRSVKLGKPPDPPSVGRAASDMRVAIFDGGLDTSVPHFTPYVRLHELTSEKPTQDDLAHGAMVTSAFLYGPIDSKNPLSQPVANVDHYRVFPLPPAQDIDHSLAWLLDRITEVVEQGRHRFVNLSLGPDEAVDEDDEPHQWTLTLDKLAKEHDVAFHCAVGNNGEDDAQTGMNRVLVPADMVNGIGVGACDSHDPSQRLQRAPYSAVGPGRYGLRTQPVGVAFGGRTHSMSPFVGINHLGQLAGDAGTSYASPFAMRGSAEVACSLPPERATTRAVRTFLAHHAVPRRRGHKIPELGLGRIRDTYVDIWDCERETCCLLYEDQLPRGSVVAMLLPFPESGIPAGANVELTWTITYLSDTNPSDAFEYTNSGLEVWFRPNERRVSVKELVGRRKKSLGVYDLVRDKQTLQEFRKEKIIELGLPETRVWKRQRGELQQRDAGKWETIVRGSVKVEAGTLFRPRLDLNHLRRESSQLVGGDDVEPLDVSMLVTMRAPAGVSLYDRVRLAHPVLVPLEVSVPVPLKSA